MQPGDAHKTRLAGALADRAILAGDVRALMEDLADRLGWGTVALFGRQGGYWHRLTVTGSHEVDLPRSLADPPIAPPLPCDRLMPVMIQDRTVGYMAVESGGRPLSRVSGEHLSLALSHLGIWLESREWNLRQRDRELALTRDRLSSERSMRVHAVVSHQLKTPIQLGQGLISDALEHAADSTRVGRRLDTLLESIQRFDRAIMSLFDRHGIRLPRHERRMAPVHFLSLCERIMHESASARRRRRMNLVLEVGPDVWGLADQSRMQIVLENLVSNAIKGGPHEGRIELAAFVEGARIGFRVVNEGGPIPPSRLEALFRPQEPNPTDPTSTGLGLSLCRDYMQQMGGGIELREHEAGTVVFEGWVARV